VWEGNRVHEEKEKYHDKAYFAIGDERETNKHKKRRRRDGSQGGSEGQVSKVVG